MCSSVFQIRKENNNGKEHLFGTRELNKKKLKKAAAGAFS